MPHRFISFVFVLACIQQLEPAVAAPDDRQAVVVHGLGGATQIPLSCAVNPIPRFSGDETAFVVTAVAPDVSLSGLVLSTKVREYIFVLGEVSPLLRVGRLDDPSDPGHPLIAQTMIGISDVAGNGTYTLMLENSGSLQRLSLLRTPAGDVVMALANRFTGTPSLPSPVDISVYRLHLEPINDGELVYFAPAFSWQTTDKYATATDALNQSFGIRLSPDGQQPCAPNPARTP